MSIEWFRDLALCIFGLGATVVLIFLAVLAFQVYRRLQPALDSMNKTARNAENLSSSLGEDVAKPVAQVVALVQGVCQAVSLVRQCTRRKEEE